MMRISMRRLAWLPMFWLVALVAGCAAPQLAVSTSLSTQLDEILTRLDDTGAIVTARVIELPQRRELYARNADAPFTPASNMKLTVSATGLDMFGPQHTFATYLALDGDELWVIGTGDPGMGDPRLAARRGELPTGVFDHWADALLARGIQRISGSLHYYDGALDAELIHPSWGEDALHWYGAPVSGLNFNDNCVDITIHPTAPGAPVRFDVMPPVRDITVINECVTAELNDPALVKLPGGNIYKISGTCSEEAALKSEPVEDPGRFFCDALRTHFTTRGIEIAGGTIREPLPLGGVLPPAAQQLIAVQRTDMRDIIGRINTNSQNFFAEALCKLSGQEYARRRGRLVPGSWADGERAIRAFLRRYGIDDRQLVVADGSGLSELNKVTARLLTDLLATMFDHPLAEDFRDSLAKGGINGTLEERFAGLENRVWAKTGYIGGVRSLSGYVHSESGQWLAFSILYNHIPGSVKPYEALQDEAVRLLVAWPDSGIGVTAAER